MSQLQHTMFAFLFDFRQEHPSPATGEVCLFDTRVSVSPPCSSSLYNPQTYARAVSRCVRFSRQYDNSNTVISVEEIKRREEILDKARGEGVAPEYMSRRLASISVHQYTVHALLSANHCCDRDSIFQFNVYGREAKFGVVGSCHLSKQRALESRR